MIVFIKLYPVEFPAASAAGFCRPSLINHLYIGEQLISLIYLLHDNVVLTER